MIDYRVSGQAVKIHVDSGLGKFTFTHECGQDYLASLMCDQYERHMRSVLEKVRKEAYNQGWKDAKAKNKKATWFKPWW